MPRFIHAADIHLDSPLRRLESYDGAPIDEIRGATRRALENLVTLAIERQVDFVVIAGDLYDGDWRDQQTGLFFVGQASKLLREGIPLYVIRGNHDAASVITKSLPLPQNPNGTAIMLGTERAESVRLEQLGATIHGRSFGTRAETENLAASYPLPDTDMFNIGLLHTSLTGAEGHEPYAPCSPQQLADMGYQYWALGHIHQAGEFQLEGGAPIVFSGNIQGRHPRETGAKGCCLVEYDSSGLRSREWVPLDVVRWEVCAIDASDADDFETIAEAYTQWLESQLEISGERLLVSRVRVHGESDLHGELLNRQQYFESVLRARAMEVGVDRVWLETLRVRTQLPSRSQPTLSDGPLASVMEVFAALVDGGAQSELWQTTGIAREFEALERKLAPDTFAADIDQLLEEARAGLIARLHGSQESQR
ncbi:metallophosphoesterase family protein [Planctomycetaceae bacterium SH139]